MTSTLQISPEIVQTVLNDKIHEASLDVLQLINVQQYDQALKTYHQILNYVALLSNREQREYVILSVINNEGNVFQSLTQLPRQEQDKWIEWLEKVQQYALNLSENSLVIAQYLRQLAIIYQTLGRTDLVAIALQQATAAAQQIPHPINRANELIQLAEIRRQFQQKAEAQQALTLTLAAIEQISSNDDPYTQENYLLSIAMLYIQLGEARRALKLAEQIPNKYSLNSIHQEVVRDAIKRGDLHLAQTVTAKIQAAEYQAIALVEMAVYWATHHQPQLGNRLFAQALKRVAKEESAEHLRLRLIQIYSTSGQLTIALNAAQRLTQDIAKAVALSTIAVAYAKANQSQQMQKILVQLKSLADWQATLMEAAINAQQYNLAIMVLNTVGNNGNFVDKPYWYRQFVQAKLQLQEIDKALQLAKQIPHDFWPEERNSSLQEIAIAYANAQQWNRAIEVVTQVKNTLITPYQVLTQVELAAVAPTPEQFATLIQSAIAQTQALKAIESKVLALVAIAQAYLHSGDEELTQSFLQQAIQTVQQVEDDEIRGRLFAQIANDLIQQQQYTAALTILQTKPVSNYEYVYGNLFQGALSSYAFDVALQVVDLESLPERQATKLLAIAKSYGQLGRNQDAMVLLDRAFAVAQQIADPETRMIDDGNMPMRDESDRAHQYTRLVKQYATIERLDKAQQVIEKVQGTYLRDYLQAWIDSSV